MTRWGTLPIEDQQLFVIAIALTFIAVGILALLHRRCYWCNTRTFFKKVCSNCQSNLDGLKH